MYSSAGLINTIENTENEKDFYELKYLILQQLIKDKTEIEYYKEKLNNYNILP